MGSRDQCRHGGGTDLAAGPGVTRRFTLAIQPQRTGQRVVFALRNQSAVHARVGKLAADQERHPSIGNFRFQRRLTGEKENLLSDVFSKAQIVDVMQIMARHVAKSPHHFISEDRNPQVVAMAEAVAQAIAEDETGLLTGADWHSIIAVAMDVALKNPGRLFSLESNNAEDAVTLVLISRLLKTSRDGIKSLPPGTTWLMFGETLSKAIRITLTAAASGALSLIKDPTKREAHLNEVSVLAGRLNKLASSDDPEKAISADDWLAIYAFYIAHVLEKGPGTLNKLSDAELLSALTDGTITLTEDTHA